MTDQENEIKWREYFYPSSHVLINNLGIKNYEELKKAEASFSFDRLLELQEKPLELGCGKKHLLELHKYIFEDIYPFAGKLRTVNLTKERGGFLFFDKQEDIDRYLDELFSEVEEKLEHCYSINDFSDILANLYTKLIYCHPFREGNGRTIREFLRGFSIEKSKDKSFGNVELDWRMIDKEELNEYVEVAHIFPGATAIIFNKALVPLSKTK
jgi:cell filamentation protein